MPLVGEQLSFQAKKIEKLLHLHFCFTSLWLPCWFRSTVLRFRSLSQISGGWHLFVSWVPLRPVLFNTVATSHMQLQSNWSKINLKCGSPFVLDTFQVFSGLWMQTREVSVFTESEIHLLIHYCYLTVGRWIYLCKTKIFQFFPFARNRKWKTTVPHGFPPIVGPTSSRLLQSSKV